MTYEAALTAIADPTRRRLLESLRTRPHTVGELARTAAVSQPAVSQHLAVLAKANLVSFRREGVRRFYRAEAEGLRALRHYLESFWDDVLAAYAAGEPPAGRDR